MAKWHAAVAVFVGLFAASSGAFAAEKDPATPPVSKPLPFEFQSGPVTAQLEELATIRVPKGLIYIDKSNIAKFMRASENLPDGDELAVVASPDFSWFAIYRFDPVGYVKDEEKDSLDADEILKQVKEATEEANKRLKAEGWETLRVVGWMSRPRYDTASNNLEWCIEATSSSGAGSLNHDIRLLGRRGVTKARLVTGKEDYTQNLLAFRELNKGFSYTSGNEYSAWVKGDKVAEYGLTALILGGGAAAAAKTGLLKTIGKLLIASWKLVIAGLLGLFALLKKLIRTKEPDSVKEPPTDSEAADG